MVSEVVRLVKKLKNKFLLFSGLQSTDSAAAFCSGQADSLGAGLGSGTFFDCKV
jgi:hypothetical protein